MSLEELLLEKWRTLPPDKQQEAIDFVEFLKFKTHSSAQHEVEPKTKHPLGDRLQKIREEIVASGVSLLDWEGVEREKAARRGGYQEETE